MRYFANFFILIFIVGFFTACTSNQRASQILQSNSATLISKDYQDITKLLIKYKKILDLRNPNLSDKKRAYQIIYEIKNNQNSISLVKNTSYKEYLLRAFEKNTRYKSDFLILGIYKMLYIAYNIKDGHHMTALGYDAKKFKKLYYTLEVLRWKIRHAKDENGKFIFATWQLNWQLEFNKKYQNITIDNLKYLPSLKRGDESIMNHSNFNFEIIMTLMIDRVKNSLEAMGEEPLNLSIDAMKALIFL